MGFRRLRRMARRYDRAGTYWWGRTLSGAYGPEGSRAALIDWLIEHGYDLMRFEQGRTSRTLRDVIEPGNKYVLVTWTFPKVGVVEEVGLDFIGMSSAARILWDGRHSTFIERGIEDRAEVEMTGEAGTHNIAVSIDSIEDVWEWKHAAFTVSH